MKLFLSLGLHILIGLSYISAKSGEADHHLAVDSKIIDVLHSIESEAPSEQDETEVKKLDETPIYQYTDEGIKKLAREVAAASNPVAFALQLLPETIKTSFFRLKLDVEKGLSGKITPKLWPPFFDIKAPSGNATEYLPKTRRWGYVKLFFVMIDHYWKRSRKPKNNTETWFLDE
ncbi:hypothetical protein KR018_004757 [Drosophila ironensis]|nr:hypothetical protein KR018_004757 [Drosophila ironensis]